MRAEPELGIGELRGARELGIGELAENSTDTAPVTFSAYSASVLANCSAVNLFVAACRSSAAESFSAAVALALFRSPSFMRTCREAPGLHFIAVRESLEDDGVKGFWLLRNYDA
ncbi:hypothetical protein T492DRAFT_869348 [Pavlovales sp. CCMP2436]|nr:hypothetical protein T492DRAFT_869348 [Pavlovales sp. CCMP2436]